MMRELAVIPVRDVRDGGAIRHAVEASAQARAWAAMNPSPR